MQHGDPERPPGGVNARWLPITKIAETSPICDESVAVPKIPTGRKTFSYWLTARRYRKWFAITINCATLVNLRANFETGHR